MLIGGALLYLFSRLSANSIDKERKRHDLAKEQLQRAYREWAQRRREQIDFINNQLRLESGNQIHRIE